jgi:predicted transcriptional regulator
MTTDQLLKEINDVFSVLQALESGKVVVTAAEEAKPTRTLKQAFKKDEIICMACGKGGMKTLTRHIKQAHGLKPGQYRKQFGIPSSQSLTAKNFSEARKKMAEERGLGAQLVKARKVRAANIKAKKATPVKQVAATKKAVPARPVKPTLAKKIN